MNCPKCETRQLEERNVKEVRVDRCPQCHGIWFDEFELPRLLESAPNDVKSLRRGRERDAFNQQKSECPRCGKGLLRVKSAANPTIVVESCPDCRGVWLDGGEFDQLYTGT